MKTPISIQIIPAQPGFYAVYADNDAGAVSTDAEVGEPIVAWRVETYSGKDIDDFSSYCTALTVVGDVAQNCIGVQNPNKSITLFNDSNYSSFEELQSHRAGTDEDL